VGYSDGFKEGDITSWLHIDQRSPWWPLLDIFAVSVCLRDFCG